jgi:hypothetical protein
LRAGALATVDQSREQGAIPMRSIKVVGLALLTVFALSAVAVSQASAAEYIYKVNGAELTSGANKEITSSAKKEFVLKGKGVLNVESVTKCTKLKVEKGALIEGGKPGKSKEKVVFEGCTATVGGTKCSGVEVENVAVVNEIVTVVKPKVLEGRLAVLFKPEKGEVFSKIKFKSCGLLGSPKAEITGSSAALSEPEKTEGTEGVLKYQVGEATEIAVIQKSSGTTEKVELDNEKTKKSTIEGEAAVALVSGEKYGIF